MSARIVRLTRYRCKGAPGEVLREACLLRGLGMQGDWHQGGERQLCLLSAEARDWMDAQEQRGLCFDRFKQNILIQGLALDALPAGSFLRIGSAVVRIGERGKRCFDACALFLAGADCQLAGAAAFATVEESGIVRAGDSATVANR